MQTFLQIKIMPNCVVAVASKHTVLGLGIVWGLADSVVKNILLNMVAFLFLGQILSSN